jgi:hypothetical protein
MTSVRCTICHDSGWVCQAHQDRPSVLVTEGGCACGAEAVPCRCNPDAVFDGWAAVFASIDDEHPRRILSS